MKAHTAAGIARRSSAWRRAYAGLHRRCLFAIFKAAKRGESRAAIYAPRWAKAMEEVACDLRCDGYRVDDRPEVGWMGVEW